MFLERDVEALRDQGEELRKRLDELLRRVVHLERRLDAMSEIDPLA